MIKPELKLRDRLFLEKQKNLSSKEKSIIRMYNYFDTVHKFEGKPLKRVREKAIILLLIERMIQYKSFKVTYSVRELALRTNHCAMTVANILRRMVEDGILGRYVSPITMVATSYFIQNEWKDKAIQSPEVGYKEISKEYIENYKYFTKAGLNKRGCILIYSIIKENEGITIRELGKKANLQYKTLRVYTSFLQKHDCITRKINKVYTKRDLNDIISNRVKDKVETSMGYKEENFENQRAGMIALLLEKKYLQFRKNYFKSIGMFKILDFGKYYNEDYLNQMSGSHFQRLMEDVGRLFYKGKQIVQKYVGKFGEIKWFKIYQAEGILCSS